MTKLFNWCIYGTFKHIELSALGIQIFIKLPFDRSVLLSDSEGPQDK